MQPDRAWHAPAKYRYYIVLAIPISLDNGESSRDNSKECLELPRIRETMRVIYFVAVVLICGCRSHPFVHPLSELAVDKTSILFGQWVEPMPLGIMAELYGVNICS